VTALAFSRPFLPLFLHVLGAMLTWGAVGTAVLLSFVTLKRPEGAFLRRATFRTLLLAIPFYVLLRIFAQVIYDREKDVFGGKDPTWVGIGFLASDLGLLLLLAAIGCAYWWTRSGKPIAGRLVAGLSSILLVLLTISMLAMSGKWD
jgi:hypothetical protein